MKIGDVVKANKPDHPLHDQLGRIWANRDWPEKHGDRRLWMVDFTPNYGSRDTFFEEELVMVLPLPSEPSRLSPLQESFIECRDALSCAVNWLETDNPVKDMEWINERLDTATDLADEIAESVDEQ